MIFNWVEFLLVWYFGGEKNGTQPLFILFLNNLLSNFLFYFFYGTYYQTLKNAKGITNFTP